jgi:hypothetical protein
VQNEEGIPFIRAEMLPPTRTGNDRAIARLILDPKFENTNTLNIGEVISFIPHYTPE